MSIDGLFKILKIIGLTEIPTTEIVYHWCATLKLADDD